MNLNEVKAISQVLREFRASCRVLPPPTSYQTPRTTVYVLSRGEGVRDSTVRRLEVELEDALTNARGERVSIRFLSSPLAIAVPREDPQDIPILPMLHRIKRSRAGELLIAVGEHYNHSGSVRGNGVIPQLLQVDLHAPTTPHVLFAGTTGAGKTVVLKNVILSGALAFAPTDAAYLLFDPKGRDFPILEGLPHLAGPIFTTPDTLLGGLRGLLGEMEQRSDRYNRMVAKVGAYQAAIDAERIFTPRIVAVVDEVAELIDLLGEEAQTAIKRLLQMGRGLGIHLVLGTQKPESSFIGGISLGNLPVRGCGAVAQLEHGKYATGIPGKQLGAHKLTGKGDFLLTINGSKIFPFQAGKIEDGEESRIIGGIAARWKGQRTPWRLSYTVAPAAKPTAAPEPRRQVDDVHDEMIALIAEQAQAQGKLPTGYQVRRMYEQRHHKQLNARTAQMLLERTQQRFN